MSVLHPQLDIAESNLLCARLLLEAAVAEPESSTQTGKPRSLIGSDVLAKQVGADLVAAQLLVLVRGEKAGACFSEVGIRGRMGPNFSGFELFRVVCFGLGLVPGSKFSMVLEPSISHILLSHFEPVKKLAGFAKI